MVGFLCYISKIYRFYPRYLLLLIQFLFISINTLYLSHEVWKDIPDFENYYQASNLGQG
ncbi:NUMOD4 domain-containing protein [Mucilaginibacter sp. RCC_168]|uniref:NUMOD4 domain-containing protein n=1 Tax=Mucilaginibacter sp. RCC_168 TaxID=3239221 RepID=UPI003523E0E7